MSGILKNLFIESQNFISMFWQETERLFLKISSLESDLKPCNTLPSFIIRVVAIDNLYNSMKYCGHHINIETHGQLQCSHKALSDVLLSVIGVQIAFSHVVFIFD